MAAVLAGGPGAVLSHASAAMAWDLRRTSARAIDVTVPTRAGREPRAGLRLHRSATLTSREVAEVRGVPVTSVARTIIDLSRTLKGRELEHIVDLADQRGLVDFTDLRAAHSASLHAVLRNYRPAPTRSELEERFLRLCDEHGIERPQVNAVIEGIEVDFVWRDRRLIVEVDGYAHHRSPEAFERDRERDVVLEVKGWRVMRFTWRQSTERAAWVAAAIGS
jgi:very-short-patch-repair endonuclease